MASTKPYRGPISLMSSKYASPTVASPGVVADNIPIATKEQVATAAKIPTPPTTPSVSTAIKNTHHLIALIRESAIKEQGDSAEAELSLAVLNGLWQELEKLSEAANDALPDTERLRGQLKMLQEKFQNQSAEYSKLVNEYAEQNEKAASLAAEVERLKKGSADFEQKMGNLRDLEQQIQELGRVKADLQVQVDKGCGDLAAAQEETSRMNKDIEAMKAENKMFQDKLQATEASKASLEQIVKEWASVARRSYQEYKDILPIYKQADQLRKENQELKEKLASCQGNSAQQSNGVQGPSENDARYWRQRYEHLLASIE